MKRASAKEAVRKARNMPLSSRSWRGRYKKFATDLKGAETFLEREEWDAGFLRQVQKYREIAELVAVEAAKRNKRKPTDRVRGAAVETMHNLLTDFGDSPPMLTPDGIWDKGAQILLDDERRSLISYMRGYRSVLAYWRASRLHPAHRTRRDHSAHRGSPVR
jgi:hypothetical protein